MAPATAITPVVCCQESAKRFNSLFQAFRIVEPVYPDDQIPAFEARERALHRRAFFGGTGFLGECFGVDADGKRADPRPAAVDLAPIAAGNSARIGAHDAVAEIIGIGLGLKTNDIIGPERAKDSLISGQSAGHFRPRPGNMHEKADPVDAAQLAQELSPSE